MKKLAVILAVCALSLTPAMASAAVDPTDPGGPPDTPSIPDPSTTVNPSGGVVPGQPLASAVGLGGALVGVGVLTVVVAQGTEDPEDEITGPTTPPTTPPTTTTTVTN